MRPATLLKPWDLVMRGGERAIRARGLKRRCKWISWGLSSNSTVMLVIRGVTLSIVELLVFMGICMHTRLTIYVHIIANAYTITQ